MNVEAFSTKKGVDFAAKFLSCHNTLWRLMKVLLLKILMQNELKIYVN
jgi:hypothetical protein